MIARTSILFRLLLFRINSSSKRQFTQNLNIYKQKNNKSIMICNSISILHNDHILFKQSFHRLLGVRSTTMSSKRFKFTVNKEELTMLNMVKDLRREGSLPSTSTPKPEDEDVKNIANDGDKKENNDENIFVIIDILKDLSENNQKYFHVDDTEFGQRIYESYVGIDCHLEHLRPLICEIQDLAPKYDYDKEVPGNGYRSFLTVVYRGIQHTINVTRRIVLKRDQMLFRKSVYVKEIEACSHLLASLQQCLEYLRTLSKWSTSGELFPRENHTPYDLLSTQTSINQYCFYGRCLGFQFCEAMSNVLKLIILCMTSFSEIYFSRSNNLLSKATNSMWVSGRYILDPELRAKRVVNLSQNAPIDFCKSFWFLAESEIMQMIPKITPASSSSVIQVNKIISIPPEPLEYLNKTTNQRIPIPIPQVHIGIKPIQVRLISSNSREGMIGSSSDDSSTSTCIEASTSLIIHCHGGGFVAQSSRSHLIYLKEWATQLNVPILSIDYSLAPEAPYPRAVQEILYAYVWALNNKHLLGTTAENIVFAGDSAGANLINVLAIKCIELNIQPPNGIFNAYVPVILNFKPTPARMLCLMDPLLPLGFMLRCIKSYTTYDTTSNISSPSGSCGPNETTTQTNSFEQITTSDLLNAHKSQVICTSDNDNVDISTISDDTIINDNDLLDDDNDSDWIKLETNQDDHDQLTFIHEFDCNNQSLIQRTTIIEQQHNQQLNMITPNNIKQRMSNLVNVITNTLNKWRTSGGADYGGNIPITPTSTSLNNSILMNDLDDNNIESVIKEFNINVPLDPHLSPYYASNDILKQLPPIRILTVELDPCLDDCVTYAKKLKDLDCDVELDILKGLPHGFLNFSLFSKEAQDGSKKCIDRIQQLLNLNQQKPD